MEDIDLYSVARWETRQLRSSCAAGWVRNAGCERVCVCVFLSSVS